MHTGRSLNANHRLGPVVMESTISLVPAIAGQERLSSI